MTFAHTHGVRVCQRPSPIATQRGRIRSVLRLRATKRHARLRQTLLITRLASPHGFSLVELLIVIGIIAALIAILLPALGRAREQARQIICSSNQRQILMASFIYADSNHGALPMFASSNQNTNSLPIWNDLANFNFTYLYGDGQGSLWPYIGAKDPGLRQTLFTCPSEPRPLMTGPSAVVEGRPMLGFYPKNYTYVFNPFLGGWDYDAANAPNPFNTLKSELNAVKLARIHGAEHKVIIIEPYYQSCETFWPYLYSSGEGAHPPMATYHSGRSNVGFADGHVELFDPSAVIPTTPSVFIKGAYQTPAVVIYYFSLPHE